MAKSTAALETLRMMIDERRFGPDGRLPPERELAASLGVARQTLRRALEVLEAEGRVWRRQGQGTFCGRPPAPPARLGVSDRTNPQEVMEVRLGVEPLLAGFAALRATAGDVERLRLCAARTASAPDAEGYELWDGALHRTIAEAAGNTLFLAVFDAVNAVRREADWENLREAARSPASQALFAGQHRRLVEAIAARDPAEASSAMREHLEAVAESLRHVVSPT